MHVKMTTLSEKNVVMIIKILCYVNDIINDLETLPYLRKWKIEIKLSIQSAFASGSRLMGIIGIRLMTYFLECM